MAAPFLVKAMLTGTGLVRNVRAAPHSRPLRFAGALVGAMIWSWLAANLGATGPFGALGFSVCVVFTYLSIRIMAMALAGLAVPGAPGRR